MSASPQCRPLILGDDGHLLNQQCNMLAASAVQVESSAGGNDLLVLMALARCMPEGSEDEGASIPLQELLALTRVSKRTVQRCIQSLEIQGEVIVEIDPGSENHYTIPSLSQALSSQASHACTNLQAMDCVMLYSEARGTALLVLLTIARFVRASGLQQGTAYPSQGTIEGLTGLNVSTVGRAVEGLQKIGEMKVTRFPVKEHKANLYEIPMLRPGGARSQAQLPKYVMTRTKEGLDLGSESIIDLVLNGSWGGKMTRVDAAALLVRDVSLRFAERLIAEGCKDPHYRSDAESTEWLYGANKLVSELLAMRGPLEDLDALYEYVATTERWQHIQTPRQIHDHLRSIHTERREISRAMDPTPVIREGPTFVGGGGWAHPVGAASHLPVRYSPYVFDAEDPRTWPEGVSRKRTPANVKAAYRAHEQHQMAVVAASGAEEGGR